LVGNGQQLGRERVQVDLVPQAGAEHFDRLRGIVLAPIKAPIHQRLDAAVSRLEQHRHDQGRAGHRPARRIPPHSAEHLSEDQDHDGVDASEQGAEQAVD
jgi:hypothetical protein